MTFCSWIEGFDDVEGEEYYGEYLDSFQPDRNHSLSRQSNRASRRFQLQPRKLPRPSGFQLERRYACMQHVLVDAVFDSFYPVQDSCVVVAHALLTVGSATST